jgi:hypothetical protein
MPAIEDSRSAQPLLAFRLGITGARNLRADQLARIHSQLGEAFALVKAEVERMSSLPEVVDAYAREPIGAVKARTYLLTPLAFGADRLAAREALDHGFEIFVPMPFPQEVYEEDFTGNAGKSPGVEPVAAEEDGREFRQLLSLASGKLELDGDRGSGPDGSHSAGRAYEAVGRFVVRHCDLLLAVWDGKPSNGRGGTAEIVHYAAITGIPVWWIHAQQAVEPEWLADIQDIQDPMQAVPESLSAEAKLQTYLKRLICPPACVPRHKSGWLDHLASRFEQKKFSPIDAYFTESPRANRLIWKTYSFVMNWSAGKIDDTPDAPSVFTSSQPVPGPPSGPVAGYWFSRYTVADGRANDYAERYRSGYLLTILSTMMVLASGACALGLSVWSTERPHWHLLLESIEGGALLLIIVLIVLSNRYEWHRKSIEYRLLAELFRKEETLAALGWALSVEKVQQLADSEQLSWVGWLFAATQRSSPLPEGNMGGNGSGRAILLNLLDEQLAYHRRREKKALSASRTFEELGSITFGAVILFVIFKAFADMSHHPDTAIGFGVAATALAGVSAAFVAIRGYAELPLLAEQSHHMIRELHNARIRVARLDTNRALVSQDLGAHAATVATFMLQDLDGWGRLFRGKLMEAT